jgi:N-acylneuraminate cytidylyltransferase
MPKLIAFIPARSGSIRVKGKNVRVLGGHPLIAYAIAAARASGVFDKIIVSTNSEQTARIAKHYGAEVPFIRPDEYATATSPDIEWIKHALSELEEDYDCFSIIRTTSPFRQAETIQRAYRQFLDAPEVDSLRAVELCREHPGKMWEIEGKTMRPLLDQSHLDVTWYAGQYQALPKVYVQNSSLEMAWTRVVWETNSREGKVLVPFLTEGLEGFAIDYEDDWLLAENYLATGRAGLPIVDVEPYQD